jgi:tetratricopeptide (TPR) repeat protein
LVKARTANIFKGILEMQNPARNAEKFAKMRHPKTSSAAVYRAGIYHDSDLREINRPLTCWQRGADGSVGSASKDADTLDTRGFVYLKAGNYTAARADFDAAIGLDARHAASFYGRALIERHEGETTGADADIAEAVKIRPDVAEDIALLGLGGYGRRGLLARMPLGRR